MDDSSVSALNETPSSENHRNMEAAVLERYGNAAQEVEACLCLPVSYDKALLKVIPDEILEKDYGCGDPSRYIREGETVVDLGSGSGKACYIISQIVGARDRVIGIDFNPPMLELARKYQKSIGDKLGYHNVEFRRGKIQDLKTNLELLDQYLKENPVRSVADLARLEEFESRMRREQPLIADESIDVIVSNCVLNLVRPEDKKQLFAEMYRVLKRGGRVAISDIVSDEPVPEHLAQRSESLERLRFGRFPRRRISPRFRRSQIPRHSDRRLAVRNLTRPSKASSFAPSRSPPTRAKKGRASSATRRSFTAARGNKWSTTTAIRWSAARAWRCAIKPSDSIRRRRTLGNLSSCRRGKKWPWITPACSTARAIINATRARPRELSSRSRNCPAALADRIPIAARRKLKSKN